MDHIYSGWVTRSGAPAARPELPARPAGPRRLYSRPATRTDGGVAQRQDPPAMLTNGGGQGRLGLHIYIL